MTGFLHWASVALAVFAAVRAFASESGQDEVVRGRLEDAVSATRHAHPPSRLSIAEMNSSRTSALAAKRVQSRTAACTRSMMPRHVRALRPNHVGSPQIALALRDALRMRLGSRSPLANASGPSSTAGTSASKPSVRPRA